MFICHDRYLSDTFYVSPCAARIALISAKKWPNGATLDVAFAGESAQNRRDFQEAAEEIMQYANLEFKIGNLGRNADIRVTFSSSGGAWSYIGTDAKRVPSNRATMNLGFSQGGTYLHEISHCLGAIHEHQNPRGGIKWNKEQVIRDLSGPPNNWDRETIERNMFQQYDEDQLNGTEFDPHSIMLYPIPNRWTLDDFHNDPNTVLSETDKRWLRNQYPSDDPDPISEEEIEVIRMHPSTASIGVAGERDVFTFTVAAAGRYRMESLGPSPVVLRLFGPNSKTRLVSQTDNAITNIANVRMDVSLNPGTYYLQISHVQPTGTGTYRPRVLWLAPEDTFGESRGEFTIRGKTPLNPGNYSLQET